MAQSLLLPASTTPLSELSIDLVLAAGASTMICISGIASADVESEWNKRKMNAEPLCENKRRYEFLMVV